MPQNTALPASVHALAQIVANEGPVGDDNDLGRPYFRHVPNGSAQWILIYTRAGAGLWEYPEWTHATHRGEAVLLRPGAPHFYRRPENAPLWNQMWVQFHPRPHWHAWLDWPSVAPGVMYMNVAAPAQRRRLEQLLHRCVVWANRPSPHWEDYTLAACEHVLLDFDAVNPRSVRHNLDPRLLKAMGYLAQHAGDSVFLPDVARVAGISVTALCHLFRRQLHTTPMRYREQARLNHHGRINRPRRESRQRTLQSFFPRIGKQFSFQLRRF